MSDKKGNPMTLETALNLPLGVRVRLIRDVDNLPKRFMKLIEKKLFLKDLLDLTTT